MALHAIPLKLAVSMGIPLVLWGENSAAEYGGDENLKGMTVTSEWLRNFGVTNGTTWLDWIDDDLTAKDLEAYRWPSEIEQEEAGVTSAFLGYFFQWDPKITQAIAAKNGFRSAAKPKTGLYDFADIDDEYLITVHHWMKWYKFGFTRLWDNLSIEIRAGRINRGEAIKIIASKDPEAEGMPEIQKFCKYIDISAQEFFNIAESFRDPNIWQKDKNGKFYIENFLIEDFRW